MSGSSQITRLQEVATEYGFEIISEGKLSLVVGGGADPAKAVTWLKENYQTKNVSEITTVGLGSTEQDLALLEAVDVPIVVPTGEGEISSSLANRNWEIVNNKGSLGWVEAIALILSKY